jgi:putative endonuclease
MFLPHELGRKGEELAADFLKQKGLTILEKNCRSGRTEIDLIATDGLFLVICEVKTRSSADFGSPEESISERKMDALAEAGAVYQEEKGLDLEFRFDIISIIIHGTNEGEIRHLEDAFHL